MLTLVCVSDHEAAVGSCWGGFVAEYVWHSFDSLKVYPNENLNEQRQPFLYVSSILFAKNGPDKMAKQYTLYRFYA